MEEELQQQAQPLLLRQTNAVQFAFTYLRSPDTRRQYPRNLKLFFDYLHLLPGGNIINNNLEEQAKAFLDKATGNPQWVEENILLFLDFHKQRVIRKEIAAGTVKNFYRPIKTFYDAHADMLPSLNWKRIARALPRAKPSSNDRVPTIEEIAKLVENNTDRRIKPIVYTMASSGIRVGAWNYLRWKHVSPKTNEKGELEAAKLLVYVGEAEEYYTFITPEAYNAPSFPPFGLVTISFMGLASYLMLVGIYYSVISVSQDIKLRTTIRRFAMDELRLLHNIGSAELRVKLENGMEEIMRKSQARMLEETGVQSSLSEEDGKQYLNEVLKELGKRKNNKASPL